MSDKQMSLDNKVVQEFIFCRYVVEKLLAENVGIRDFPDDDFKKFVIEYCQKNNLSIPKSETIRRTRQKVQNTEGKFPMSQNAKVKRMEKEEIIRKNIKYF